MHCTLIDKNHASIVQRLQEPLCLAKQLVLQARIYHKCIDSKKSYGHRNYIKAFFVSWYQNLYWYQNHRFESISFFTIRIIRQNKIYNTADFSLLICIYCKGYSYCWCHMKLDAVLSNNAMSRQNFAIFLVFAQTDLGYHKTRMRHQKIGPPKVTFTM